LILEVLSYPNKKLYEISKEVEVFDEKLHKLLDDMYETMIAKEGIGLVANEEGVQDKENLIEIINPKFELREGECVYQEGCLSVPGYYEDVKRSEVVAIKFQDRFGKEQTLKTDGLLAIAIQHENDHLDGHLFIEKIGFNKRKKFDKEYKKQKKEKTS